MIKKFAMLYLVVLPAFAGGHRHHEIDPALVSQGQGQLQGQSQEQVQGQLQGQSQSAKANSRADASAKANATGGNAQQSQSANNEGNNQSITIQGARQIASLSQGSWAAPECGAGGNAGGSGTGGAGFLGLYWTPADCKLMSIAYTWAHLGMYGEACKTLTATKTLRNAYARYDLPLPDCTTLIAALTTPAPEPSSPPVIEQPDLSKYATKEEVTRMFKATISK